MAEWWTDLVEGGTKDAAAPAGVPPPPTGEMPPPPSQWTAGNTMMAGALGAAAAGGAYGITRPTVARALQLTRLLPAERYALSEISDAARRAGVPIAQARAEMEEAYRAGQPFTVMDAFRHEGQRKAAALAKVPGEQRQMLIDAMQQRSDEMAGRTGSRFGSALGVGDITARQAEEELLARAQRESAPYYARAMAHPTWSPRLQDLLDYKRFSSPGLKAGYQQQEAEAVSRGLPFRPEDMHITSFNEAGDPVISGTPNMRTLQTLKIGLDQMLDSAAMKTPQGTWTGEAKQIIAYRKALLDELKALNPHYAEANRIYGGPMEVRRAIEFGREMPRPSERYADTLREYADMPLVEQHGARIGYADVVRGKLESGGNYPAILRDKSPKGQAEIAALAGPEAEPLRRYLGREQRMKEGDIKIRGGSSTMENVADVMSTPSAADVLGIGQAIMTGSPTKMVSAVAPHLQMGASERQRVELARRLMMQDPAQAARLMDQLQALEDRRNRGLRSWFGWGP